MSYQTPNTTWSDSDVPTPADFNRMEGNTEYLKDAVDSNASDILSNGSSISALIPDVASNASTITVLVGSGSAQGVGTTDTPTFAAINTGQGDVECYYMNQNVRTSDAVSFGSISASAAITSGGLLLANSAARITSGDLDIDSGDINATSGTAYVGALNSSGAITPTRTITSSWTISSFSAETPSAGLYFIAEGTGVEWQMYANSAWRYVGNGGMLITDGSLVRVYNAGGNSVTVYYHKF